MHFETSTLLIAIATSVPLVLLDFLANVPSRWFNSDNRPFVLLRAMVYWTPGICASILAERFLSILI